MTKREALISDHKEMLVIRIKGIKEMWNKRHDTNYDRSVMSYRECVRWGLEQAKMHKHMVEQLESLPDMKPLDFWIFGL